MVAGGGEGGPGTSSVAGSGPLLALDLSFDLPPSCYATMLVRELTKACTGKGAHAMLSAGVAAAHQQQQQQKHEAAAANGGAATTATAAAS